MALDTVEQEFLDTMHDDSIQARGRRAPWESANYPSIGPMGMDMFLGNAFGALLTKGEQADEIRPWSYYPMLRDRQLRHFWKTEGILAGAIYSMAARIGSLPVNVTGGPRGKAKAQALLHNLDVQKLVVDLFTTDNGIFIERVGPGRPDKPLNPRLIQALAVMDSGQCWRTFDPEFPVIYINPYTSQYHKLHYSRVITGSSMPQPDELARGIGYCAVSRTKLYVQIARDIAIYKHEKISGRFTRAIGILRGFTPKTVNETLEEHEQKQDALGFTRYKQIPWLVTQSQDAQAQLVNLATLPDGFDAEKDIELYVNALALGFGTDAREFWPMTGSGATKADATVQHEKARGKGIADVLGILEEGINWGVLDALGCEAEYDYTDDAEQMANAQYHFQVITNVATMQQAGNINTQQGTAILIAKNIIDPAVLSSLAAAEQAEPAYSDAPYHQEDVAVQQNAIAQAGVAPLKPPAPASQTTPMPAGTPKPAKPNPEMKTTNMMEKAAKFRPPRKALSATTAYQNKLKALAGDFFDGGYTDDPDELDNRIDDLRKNYLSTMTVGLSKAFLIGAAGAAISAWGKRQLQKVADSTVEGLDNTLDDLRTAALSADADTFDDLADGFTNRFGMGDGAYWNAIWQGNADNLRQQGGALRVQRVLDPDAAHCATCPPKEGIYDDFETMASTVGVPGDWSDDCKSGCRCSILVETEPGSGDFQPLIGSPSVYTEPLFEVE